MQGSTAFSDIGYSSKPSMVPNFQIPKFQFMRPLGFSDIYTAYGGILEV